MSLLISGVAILGVTLGAFLVISIFSLLAMAQKAEDLREKLEEARRRRPRLDPAQSALEAPRKLYLPDLGLEESEAPHRRLL